MTTKHPKALFTFFFFSLFLLGGNANASEEEAFHPPRMRLLFHGELEIPTWEKIRFVGLFIPADDLLQTPLSPYTYLGVRGEATNWLALEAYAGWGFPRNEPILSLVANPYFENVWASAQFDLQIPATTGYWFTQIEYAPGSGNIQFGLEGEGWGQFGKKDNWSNGGGPNVLVRLGKLQLDLALHVRNANGSFKPEPVLRAHLYL